MKNIKVILADDHVIVRNGIKVMLESEVEVIGEASDGEEALALSRELKPDILICDIRMPVMNGIEATAQLHKFSPTTKSLILSMHDDEEYIIKSIEAGASGYLLKDTTKEEFIKALHAVMSGQKYFSGDISNILVQHYLKARDHVPQKKTSGDSGMAAREYHITRREMQILEMIYQGLSNKDMADKLNKSVRTVETHRFNIMKKLSVGNITELIRKIDEEHLLV